MPGGGGIGLPPMPRSGGAPASVSAAAAGALSGAGVSGMSGVVRTAGGDIYRVTFLITAVGCLSSANVPRLKGLEGFGGDWYHTGLWPHDGVDFAGKRVGQIGTGSTGIQAVPVIAEQAGHLTVFQRTANYSIPARNAPLSDEFKQYVKSHHPEIRALMHSTLLWKC